MSPGVKGIGKEPRLGKLNHPVGLSWSTWLRKLEKDSCGTFYKERLNMSDHINENLMYKRQP